MQDKLVALVTGANQGIGLQIAKDLAVQGFTVLVGSRNFERGVVALTKAAETFVFENIGEAPVPSLNRGFSAPIKLVANQSAEDLRFLAARDGDAFNRWQALQTLATRLLVERHRDEVRGRVIGPQPPIGDQAADDGIVRPVGEQGIAQLGREPSAPAP